MANSGTADTHIASRQYCAVFGLLAMAVIVALYFSADLLRPIVAGILLSILLAPVVRSLARRRVPRALSALLLVGLAVALAVSAFSALAAPAEKWLVEAPKTVRKLQRQLTPSKGPMADIKALAKEVDNLTAVDADKTAQPVVVQDPGVLNAFLNGAPAAIASAGIALFLTYFLLSSGDLLLPKLVACGRTFAERRRILKIVRSMQTDLSRYLATVASINLALGIVVTIAMHFMHVPNPILWGAMAAVFNFAPYIGAAATTLVLTIVGLSTFPTFSAGIVVPLVFLGLTIVEGQLITPTILGYRMALNPVVVFLAVLFWGWLWGVLGALMAVPIVTSLNVLCKNIVQLQPLGEFLTLGPTQPAVRRRLKPGSRHKSLPGSPSDGSSVK